MKLLLISDLHGKIENLEKLKGEIKSSDAVLFAGDFTKFNDYQTTEPCVKKMRELCPSLFCVIGNCDKPELLQEIESLDMSVEKSLVCFDGIQIAGSGGGSKFSGDTPNERTEEDLQKDFGVVENSGLDSDGQWSDLILISHNPPKGAACDQVAPKVHVGSQTLTDFINQIKPLAVLCGHIHEGRAVDKIGQTVVVNPGPLLDGNYAVMEIQKEKDSWKVLSVELKNL